MFVMLWQSYETGDNHGIKLSPKQTQLRKNTIFRNIWTLFILQFIKIIIWQEKLQQDNSLTLSRRFKKSIL
jgi:hypothetical protein